MTGVCFALTYTILRRDDKQHIKEQSPKKKKTNKNKTKRKDKDDGDKDNNSKICLLFPLKCHGQQWSYFPKTMAITGVSVS